MPTTWFRPDGTRVHDISLEDQGVSAEEASLRRRLDATCEHRMEVVVRRDANGRWLDYPKTRHAPCPNRPIALVGGKAYCAEHKPGR